MARILIIAIWIPFPPIFAFLTPFSRSAFGYPFYAFFSRASGTASNGSDTPPPPPPPGIITPNNLYRSVTCKINQFAEAKRKDHLSFVFLQTLHTQKKMYNDYSLYLLLSTRMGNLDPLVNVTLSNKTGILSESDKS